MGISKAMILITAVQAVSSARSGSFLVGQPAAVENGNATSIRASTNKHEVKVTEAASVPKSLADAKTTHATDAGAGSMTHVTLGPFESHVDACKYCFTSHTRTSVVKNCICTAYSGDDGPTMFCTASKPGINYSSKKDGACKCVEKDMEQMGKTTCVSWDN